MKNKLKVAMVGGWGHGISVIRDFIKDNPENAELVAMGKTCEEETFWDLPEDFGEISRYNDYIKMLKEVKPDVAVVSTGLKYINEACIRAAENGCHIISEKPIAVSKKQLKNLYQKMSKNNLKLMLLLDNRENPYFKAARSLVTKNIIGEVVMVNARKSYPWSDDRVEKYPIKYGGTVGWVGIHALDFINGITGLDFEKVTGMESNQISPDFVNCPDNCGLVLELTNGAHATVSIDYHRPEASSTHGDDWIRVVGKRGTLKCNLSRGKISCCTRKEERLEVDIPGKGSIFQKFYDYILKNRYQDRFDRITGAAFSMTETCIIAQKAILEEKILKIKNID